jgi:hypothetical protein
MTAERLVDVWAADVERRARHHAAVIAAAHRLAAVVLDTDPTPRRALRDVPTVRPLDPAVIATDRGADRPTTYHRETL